MAKVNRTRVLAEAVASSFEAAGFSPVALLQGPINITDLGWDTPPLKAEATLQKVPFSSYLDYPMGVKGAELYNLYERGLYLLREEPETLADNEGIRNLTSVLPTSKSGERKLVLPTPVDWPTGDHLSGARFAADVAHLFRTSSADCLEFVDEGNNYWARTPWGPVGLVEGQPTLSKDIWDAPCTDVQSLLQMPRGLNSATCHYDLIARLRSVLHENDSKFAEFEGMDLALQALRVLSDGQLCRDLQRAVEQMSLAAFKRKARSAAFAEAVTVMESWHLTDRTKISMLFEILVPAHYRLEVYARKILDPRKVLPAVLSRKTETRIINTLKHERDKHAQLP